MRRRRTFTTLVGWKDAATYALHEGTAPYAVPPATQGKTTQDCARHLCGMSRWLLPPPNPLSMSAVPLDMATFPSFLPPHDASITLF